MRRSLVPAWLLAASLVSGCADPPNKEMGQAQGAIDAARAAGADKYATDEFTAATSTMQQANEAVAQRDYRLALNRALESREHAQNAAREAATTGARLRGEVERSMAEIAALMAQANSRLTAADQGRVSSPVVRNAHQTLAQVNDDVQKAGAAMKADDYNAALSALMGVKERIARVISSLNAALPRRRG